MRILATTGIDAKTDSRLRSVIASLPTPPQVLNPIDLEVVAAQPIMLSALQGTLAIPSWEDFVKVCEDSFDTALKVTSGTVAAYIPVLAKADPNKFGVSVCSVDGSGGHVEMPKKSLSAVTYEAAQLRHRARDKVMTRSLSISVLNLQGWHSMRWLSISAGSRTKRHSCATQPAD